MPKGFAKSLSSLIFPSLLLIAALGGVVLLQLPRANQEQTELTATEARQQEQVKLLRLNFLRELPSFGYANLLADWLFLDFIQYYGDAPARKLTGHGLSDDYFATIVAKDPRFVEAYFLLAPATSLFAGEPLKSIELLNQGLEYMNPKMALAYQVWLYKGIDETLFLGNYKIAQKSYEKAAEWAAYHDTQEAQIAAQRAKQTAAFLGTNPDGRLVQASAWLSVYINARDEQTRELAAKEIEKLGGKIIITPGRISVKMSESAK